jgi:hypothetical protein
MLRVIIRYHLLSFLVMLQTPIAGSADEALLQQAQAATGFAGLAACSLPRVSSCPTCEELQFSVAVLPYHS